MARKTTITGAGIRDDSVTGDDIDESTLVLDALRVSVLNINSSNDPGTSYTIGSSDCIILVNTRATNEGGINSAITITLPSASDNPGRMITIKDAGGFSNVNNITISRSGSDTIEGIATTITLNAIAAFTTLISNGSSDWSEIGKG